MSSTLALCPTCGTGLNAVGSALRCTCGGTWISEGALGEMVATMRHAPATLPWGTRAGEARACPICTHPMVTTSLANIALDRCERHGIWFDPEELLTLLQRADSFPAAPRHGVPVPDVRNLDGRAHQALVGDSAELEDGGDGLLGIIARLIPR